MAMNKAEKKLVEDLQEQVALLSSWRLTEDVPKDVDPTPLTKSDRKVDFLDGWVFNSYNKSVSPCRTWSHAHKVHNRGATSFDNRSQNAVYMYSTEVKALKALRRQLELEYMRELSKIDRQIKKLEG